MTVDMGGIAWPLRSTPASTAQIGSAKLDRQVAYGHSAEPLAVTAMGVDGKPVTSPLEVVLTSSSDTVRRTTDNGRFSPAGLPPGRYSVTVAGVPAGRLRVL